MRDISKDLTGFPSLQEDAPSLKRGFLERKTSDLKKSASGFLKSSNLGVRKLTGVMLSLLHYPQLPDWS